MSKIIEILIEVLIFTAVIGTIANSITNAPENLTGGSLVLYGLITLIVVAGFIVLIAKRMGIKGGK